MIEPTRRTAEDRVCLVIIAIPLPILIADDLRRQDNAERAHVVLFADARIDDLIIRTKREFCRAREFPVAQHLDLVFARILPHGKVGADGSTILTFVPERRLLKTEPPETITVGRILIRLGTI